MKSFFILGNPRSGTTLLRLMLNSHPEIVIPPECGFVHWWHKKYKNWENNNNYNQLDDFITDLKKSKKIETWKLDYEKLKKFILKNSPDSYNELCENVYLFYAKNKINSIKYWGDKNNYYIHHLDVINKIYPDTKYIHLIRDCRDVACSYIDLNKLSENLHYRPNLPSEIINIAEQWNNNVSTILDFFGTLNKEEYITIKFEDLIFDSNKVLSRITNFLGLEYNDSMLEYYTGKYSQPEPNETLYWKKKTLSKPQKEVVGRYKDILTSNEIKMINKIGFNLLKEFKYI